MCHLQIYKADLHPFSSLYHSPTKISIPTYYSLIMPVGLRLFSYREIIPQLLRSFIITC